MSPHFAKGFFLSSVPHCLFGNGMVKELDSGIKPQPRQGQPLVDRPHLFLFVCAFLLSVQFEHPFGVYPYPYIFMVVLVLVLAVIARLRSSINLRASLFLLIFLAFTSAQQMIAPSGEIKEMLTLFLALACSFLLIEYAKTNLEAWKKAILSLLSLNIWLFGFQVAAFIYAGKYFDLHNALFPWSEGKGGIGWFGEVRFVGYHQEPGAYAAAVAVFALLSIHMEDRARWQHLAAALTCALSFSGTGIVYASAIGILLIWQFGMRNFLSIGLAIILASTSAVLIQTFVMEKYILYRFFERESDASLNVRLNNFDQWQSWDLSSKILGGGLGLLRDNANFLSLQGSGFFLATAVTLGLGWLALFIMGNLLFSRGQWPDVMILIVALFVLATLRVPPVYALPYLLMYGLFLSGEK